MKRLMGFWRLMRPSNVGLFLLIILLGGITEAGMAALFSWELWLLAISGTLVGSGGNVINDVYDLRIDAINKPSRPLVTGVVSLKAAVHFWGALTGFGIGLGVIVSDVTGLIAALSSIILVVYSRFWKNTILLGNSLVASVVMIGFLYGALHHGLRPSLHVLFPAILTFLAVFAREVLKDMEDVAGDKANGILTLVGEFGIDTAKWVFVLVQSITVAFSFLPLFVTRLFPLSQPFLYLLIMGFGFAAFSIRSIIVALQTSEPRELYKLNEIQKVAFFLAILAIAIGQI